MEITVDLDSRKVKLKDELQLQRGTQVPLKLRFVRDGRPRRLIAAADITVALRRRDNFDSAVLAVLHETGDGTVLGRPVTQDGFYEGDELDLNTTVINDPVAGNRLVFLDAETEKEEVYLQVLWSEDDSTSDRASELFPTYLWNKVTDLGGGQVAVPTPALGALGAGLILVVHTNGTSTVYAPAANTDAARGAALAAAKTGAVSGETIFAGPGGYTISASLAKTTVDWHFFSGATITRTGGAIFNDGGTAMTFKVTGQGAFVATESGGLAGNVVSTTHASSVIHFEAASASVSASGETGTAVFVGVGTLYADVGIIANTGAHDYCVWWHGGDWHINARRITSSSSDSHTIAGDAGAGQKLWVTADEIESTGTNIGAVLSDTSSSATAVMWIEAKEIRAVGNTSNPAVDCRNGKVYVTCQKLMASTGSPFSATGANALLYLAAQKIESGDIATLSNGKSYIDVLQFLDNADASTQLVTVSGGTHSLRVQSMERTAAGHGILVSGGTAKIKARIDTSASNTSNPISKSGGTLILEPGTILVAEATRDSITAGTAQNVVALGAWANKTVHSNVTITTEGGLVIDTAVA